jgi:hypothetical protein
MSDIYKEFGVDVFRDCCSENEGPTATEMKMAQEIKRLRARVEELERKHPVIPTAGCQCPPGANIHCANSWCPRKSLSFQVTSTLK